MRRLPGARLRDADTEICAEAESISGSCANGFGFRVCESSANFILFYTELPLYKMLLKKKILIRDCSNYEGLTQGYYRIAVKREEENRQLLKMIGECIENN